MPTSKKPRKKYRQPREKIVRPIVFALKPEDRVNLQLAPHATLDAFKLGAGDESGWHTLAQAVNFGAVLSRAQPADVQAVMSRALDALVAVRLRFETSGQWGVSGDEYRSLGEALSLANDIQDASTRRELRDALRITLQEAAI